MPTIYYLSAETSSDHPTGHVHFDLAEHEKEEFCVSSPNESQGKLSR
jgi:hypothetical protein